MKHLLTLSMVVLMVSCPAFAEEQALKASLIQDQPTSLVYIEKTPIPLFSKLKKKYSAYKIIVKSNNPDDITLINGTLINGVAGSIGSESVHTTTAWAFVGLIGLLGGMIIIGLPTFLIIDHSNKKAENESMAYSNQVPSFDLKKDENVTFNTLVPLGQNPQVDLNFKDEKTGQTFSVKKNLTTMNKISNPPIIITVTNYSI